MSASYPASVYAPRTKANKSGVVYDSAKTTQIYAEDISKSDDEVVAIETELGANPKGAYASVVARLNSFFKVISKPSDTSRQNTTVLADDPDLTFAYESGKKYRFRFSLILSIGSDADFKYKLAVDEDAGGNWKLSSSTAETAVLGTSSEYTILVGSDQRIFLEGSGYFTAGDYDGNFRLQWAQNTLHADWVTVEKGSILEVLEIG